MLNIKEIYQKQVVEESMACKHTFQDGDITFAALRDLFTKVLSGGGVMLSKKVPSMNVLLTYKDGQFCIEADPKKISKPCCYDKFSDKCCNGGKNVKLAFKRTIQNLVEALEAIDPVLLNRFFANGQNFADCQIIYPPEDTCQFYDDKCFVRLNDLKSYDKNFKLIGRDEASEKELFDALSSSSCLSHEMSEISNDNAVRLHRCHPGKKVLAIILQRLGELIDGIGWGCTLNSYIQDKYSRYIINKALEHNLDVSRNSSFVNELVSRLAKVKTKLRPTKSDLVTFAKREGINCHSDDYKAFLSDIEGNCDSIAGEIIKPVEDLIYFGAASAMNSILGYMAIDPCQKTQKVLDGIDCSCCQLGEDEKDSFSEDRLAILKKGLSKILQYQDSLPKCGITIMYKKQPYSVLSKIEALDELCRVLGC